jgi:hypothetical protein
MKWSEIKVSLQTGSFDTPGARPRSFLAAAFLPPVG